MLVRDNGMVTDRLTVGGDPVHLGDIQSRSSPCAPSATTSCRPTRPRR